MSDIEEARDEAATKGRREFLKKCGTFAVVVPPTMALLLARDATAQGANDCFSGAVMNPAGKCPPGQQ